MFQKNFVETQEDYAIENALTVFEGYSMCLLHYVTASLSCDFVLKDFTLNIPFSEHDVSYLRVSEEETNQLLKISGN